MLSVKYKCNQYVTEIRWKVEDFLAFAPCDDPNRRLRSEDFSLYKSRLKFHLVFDPTNAQEQGSKQHSSLYLMPRYLDNQESVTLKWAFWLENLDGKFGWRALWTSIK